MTIFLVRHGRPLVEDDRPAAEWELDPAGFDHIWALRESGRLPRRALWFSSPERKARQTAELLTDTEVGVVDALREQLRGPAWVEDFETVVRAAFAHPEQSAYAGWESLATTRERVVNAVRLLREQHPGEDLVLVGHGTAWTLLVADLLGSEPDLDRWASLGLPDVIEVPA